MFCSNTCIASIHFFLNMLPCKISCHANVLNLFSFNYAKRICTHNMDSVNHDYDLFSGAHINPLPLSFRFSLYSRTSCVCVYVTAINEAVSWLIEEHDIFYKCVNSFESLISISRTWHIISVRDWI